MGREKLSKIYQIVTTLLLYVPTGALISVWVKCHQTSVSLLVVYFLTGRETVFNHNASPQRQVNK